MRSSPPAGSRRWTPLSAAGATLAFALELGALASLAYWGFTIDGPWPARVLLGIGGPVAVAVLWWLFLAGGGPKFPVPVAAHFALKLVVFAAAALALYGSGHPVAGIVFAGLGLVSVAVEAGTGQRRGR
ncbi:MAG TPA: YrdB family protein [Streptosporangiaceae bacterium]